MHAKALFSLSRQHFLQPALAKENTKYDHKLQQSHFCISWLTERMKLKSGVEEEVPLLHYSVLLINFNTLFAANFLIILNKK